MKEKKINSNNCQKISGNLPEDRPHVFFVFFFVFLKSRNIHAEQNIRTAKEEHKNAC